MATLSADVFPVEHPAKPVPSSETMALDPGSTELGDPSNVVDLQSEPFPDHVNLDSVTSSSNHILNESQSINFESFTSNGAPALVTQVSSGAESTARYLSAQSPSHIPEEQISQLEPVETAHPAQSASSPASESPASKEPINPYPPSPKSLTQTTDAHLSATPLISTGSAANFSEEIEPPASATEAADRRPSSPLDTAPSRSPSQTVAADVSGEHNLVAGLAVDTSFQMDQEMQDMPEGTTGKIARSREEDDTEESHLRSPKRAKTESEETVKAEFKVPEPPNPKNDALQKGGSSTTRQSLDTAPLTKNQQLFLTNQLRNLKKIKHALPFNKPVDFVAMNIPSYPTIVPHSMDLGTMETKLKAGQYLSVDDYVADFDLMVQNCFNFNGMQHPVSTSAQNLKASFDKGLQHLPKSIKEASLPAEKVKKFKTMAVPAIRDRRQSRPSIPSASSPTGVPPSPSEAFALNADGLPTIRRDSAVQNGRPKREIKHAGPRDLPYSSAKPKRKKYALELKFCQDKIVDELHKSKYMYMTWPFDKPVDPVALNIPTYHKLIKKPMDFGTITMKLKSAQYENAKDFESDVRLMFSNCYKFNPPTDNVHMLGKQLEAKFDELWSSRGEWMAEHAPHSGPHSPSFAQESDDEQEDEGENVDDVHDRMLQIQQQISKLSAEAVQLQVAVRKASPKAGNKKAAKGSKPTMKNKKAASNVALGGSKKQSKPARPKRYVTYEEKQEIAEKIDSFNAAQMDQAVSLIRTLQPTLPGIMNDDLELDVDELENDTLYQLLMFVRQINGKPKGPVEDEYRPPRPGAATAMPATPKPKKNKPMSKIEQENNLHAIRNQLGRFNNTGLGSDHSPEPVFENNAESSGDDEESGSESEEE